MISDSHMSGSLLASSRALASIAPIASLFPDVNFSDGISLRSTRLITGIIAVASACFDHSISFSSDLITISITIAGMIADNCSTLFSGFSTG